MKRYMLWMVAPLLILHLSSCDVRAILPNDLSDPAHARYVASGDKDKDRQQFEAYLLLCPQILQPYLDAEYQACLLEPDATPEGCRNLNSVLGTLASIECAARLVDYHSGARKYEFNDLHAEEAF